MKTKQGQNSDLIESGKLLLFAVVLSAMIYIEYLYDWWNPNPKTMSEWVGNAFMVIELIIDIFLIGISIYLAIFKKTSSNLEADVFKLPKD